MVFLILLLYHVTSTVFIYFVLWGTHFINDLLTLSSRSSVSAACWFSLTSYIVYSMFVRFRRSTKLRSVFVGLDGKRVVKGQPAPHIECRLLGKSLKTLVISKGKPAPAWTCIVVKMALKGQPFECLYLFLCTSLWPFMHLYRFPECQTSKDVAGTHKTHYRLLKGGRGKEW